MAELSILARAVRPSNTARDFLKESHDAVERTLTRESFTPYKNEDLEPDELMGQINVADMELAKLNKLTERVEYIRANIDNMSDIELVNSLNAIEPVFTNNEAKIATESYGTSIRTRASLACESMGERLKFATLALIITAFLKIIAWLIKSIADTVKSKRSFNKTKDRGLSKKQQKIEEEVVAMAKDRTEQILDKKYEVYSETVKSWMMRLYNYSSPGNLREPGGKGAGTAAEIASIMIDYINSKEEKSYDEKKILIDNSFKIIFTLIDHNVPLGHFAFNDETREIIAKDFVDFADNGFQGPISKLMSMMAVIVSSRRGGDEFWLNYEPVRNNDVRMFTENSGEDLMYYLDRLTTCSSYLDKFMGGNTKATRSTEFLEGSDLASVTDFYLNTRVKFSTPEEYEHYARKIGEQYDKAAYLPAGGDVVSSPMKLTLEGKRQQVNVKGGHFYIIDEKHKLEFVGPAEYKNTISWLNSLSGDDAVVTFAKWFYSVHGDYDKNDNIESRFFSMIFSYHINQNNARADLKRMEKLFEDYHRGITQLAKARSDFGSNGRDALGNPIFTFDVLLPDEHTTFVFDNGKMEDFLYHRRLGHKLGDLITLYKDSLKGWGALMRMLDNYINIAEKINLKRPR